MGERERADGTRAPDTAADEPRLADRADDDPPRVDPSAGDPGHAGAPPRWARPTGGDFGWRGWALVGMIVVSFLIVPTIMVALAYRPSVVGSFGLTFQDAYLALPMIPAIGLAIVAVWAALHARRD